MREGLNHSGVFLVSSVLEEEGHQEGSHASESVDDTWACEINESESIQPSFSESPMGKDWIEEGGKEEGTEGETEETSSFQSALSEDGHHEENSYDLES